MNVHNSKQYNKNWLPTRAYQTYYSVNCDNILKKYLDTCNNDLTNIIESKVSSSRDHFHEIDSITSLLKPVIIQDQEYR